MSGHPQDLPAQPGPAFVPGEVLIGLQPTASLSEVARLVGGKPIRGFAHGNAYVLSLVQGSVGVAVHTLRAAPGVAFAEPNYLRSLHDQPNDPGYALKWDLHNDGSLCEAGNCAKAGADLDWQEAYSYLGPKFEGSAVVAVIDTGIDANHPDLQGKVVGGYDFLDRDPDPQDTHGHGTHVAGIVLAATDNGVGTVGLGYCAGIQVMPLRVCDEQGCPTSAIVEAVYYAADNGAQVINLSLGGRSASAAEEQALLYAWSQGLVIVASSGNDGRGRVAYPAAFAHCLAVASTDWHDQLASYSSTGNDLDVVAPGGQMAHYGDPGGIYSTMPTYEVYLTHAYAYQQNYDQMQGTSMAAPQVSGLAGLLFALGVADADHDGKNNDEIRDLIETTTDDLGKAGWDRDFGWGRVNVMTAVRAARGSADAPPQVAITNPHEGDTLSGLVTVTAEATDDRRLLQVEFSLDGLSIGVDDDGADGWTVSWASDSASAGPHTVTATATDSAFQTASDSVGVVVSNAPALDVVVLAIAPNVVQSGASIELQISGSGFAPGAKVSFADGDGPVPQAGDVAVVDGGTILVTVTAKSGGPPHSRAWNVTVTNTNGAAGVLVGGLTVTP